MIKVLEMGSHYVSDFVKSKEETKDRTKYSLDIYLDGYTGAPRLSSADLAPHGSMWGKYWYRSGINSSMTNELKQIGDEIQSRLHLKTDDIWLDIACNDGTLLKFLPNYIKKIGIDPADDTFFAESSKYAEVIQEFFSKDAWNKTTVANKKAKVITCIAMFYDLNNPHPFVQDMYDILDDDGLIVIQMSYTPLMIKQMAFDNICHEHVYYHDLTSINNIFSKHDMKIVDCSLNDTNGGSFRVYIQKNKAKNESFGSTPFRDVCSMRVHSLFSYENNELNIRKQYVWDDFSFNLKKLKTNLTKLISDIKKEGKTIYGYGASTKGNTLLQYFELTSNEITAIAERSHYKFGLKTIGTHIPIVSEEEMREAKPDYLLVLPWHFINEFVIREQVLLSKGTKMIVPCPKVEIISYEN